MNDITPTNFQTNYMMYLRGIHIYDAQTYDDTQQTTIYVHLQNTRMFYLLP